MPSLAFFMRNKYRHRTYACRRCADYVRDKMKSQGRKAYTVQDDLRMPNGRKIPDLLMVSDSNLLERITPMDLVNQSMNLKTDSTKSGNKYG